VTKSGAQIRRGGSAALDLAYVAAGRFDGFFELGLKPWDIAAGELIVKKRAVWLWMLVVVMNHLIMVKYCLLIENVKTINANSCSSLGRSCKINFRLKNPQ
jgi:hypothetical protein